MGATLDFTFKLNISETMSDKIKYCMNCGAGLDYFGDCDHCGHKKSRKYKSCYVDRQDILLPFMAATSRLNEYFEPDSPHSSCSISSSWTRCFMPRMPILAWKGKWNGVFRTGDYKDLIFFEKRDKHIG
jgi:hypothetical protein